MHRQIRHVLGFSNRSNPPPALRLSLIAVAMTRLGWLYQDEASVRYGRVVYGHALIGLQRALCDENSMYQDETLATCNILALYEVGEFHVSVFRSSNHSCAGARRIKTRFAVRAGCSGRDAH